MFSWDARKALANLKKHGVSLRRRLLSSPIPMGLDYDDIEHSESELRSVRIGLSPIGRIVFVVYTRRVKYDKETIRIISARQATRKERAAYAG